MRQLVNMGMKKLHTDISLDLCSLHTRMDTRTLTHGSICTTWTFADICSIFLQTVTGPLFLATEYDAGYRSYTGYCFFTNHNAN